MNPATETCLISTISKRLERIANGQEVMEEGRAHTLLSILRNVPQGLDALPQTTKQRLGRALNAKIEAMMNKTEIVDEEALARLVESVHIIQGEE